MAGWAPTFAIVTHVGRRSGHVHETPVNVFRVGDQYVVALTYGESQWVKNVLSAGECTVRTCRRDVRLVQPECVIDPSRHWIPMPFRWVLRLLDVDRFLVLRAPPTVPRGSV